MQHGTRKHIVHVFERRILAEVSGICIPVAGRYLKVTLPLFELVGEVLPGVRGVLVPQAEANLQQWIERCAEGAPWDPPLAPEIRGQVGPPIPPLPTATSAPRSSAGA